MRALEDTGPGTSGRRVDVVVVVEAHRRGVAVPTATPGLERPIAEADKRGFALRSIVIVYDLVFFCGSFCRASFSLVVELMKRGKLVRDELELIDMYC